MAYSATGLAASSFNPFISIGRELNEGERILLRTDAGESDLELSRDELMGVQTVEINGKKTGYIIFSGI